MLADLERLLTILDAARIEYIVIGGVAMSAHGSAHVTYDLDICYRRTKDNIERLCNALEPIHPFLRGAPKDLPFRFEPKTVQAGMNFTLVTDLGDLDLLGEVTGLGNFDAISPVSESKVYGDSEVRVVNLEALIRSKRAAGRAKDLSKIDELEALRDLKDRLKEG